MKGAGAATWNARALLLRSPVKRQKKLSHLEANIVNATLVALQEVHGSDAEIRAALARFRSHWYIDVSAGPDRATGGVVIMVRRSALWPDATVANCVVVAGRVLRVCHQV